MKVKKQNVLVVGSDRRAARMVRDPEGYFRQARQRARAEADAALRRERDLKRRSKAD